MDAAAASRHARNSGAEAASQAAINRQLMERKAQMEWQLMAALAENDMVGCRPNASASCAPCLQLDI